jgi:hypothetical protein
MTPIPEARACAEEHGVFCNGLIEAGLAVIGHKGRYVARLLGEMSERVEAAENALTEMTADRDRWRDNRWREVHGEAWPK